jgi:hypothetical protein
MRPRTSQKDPPLPVPRGNDSTWPRTSCSSTQRVPRGGDARDPRTNADVSPTLLEPEADALGIVANQLDGEVVLVGLQEHARSSRHLRKPSARTAVGRPDSKPAPRE